jgi:hypothetical protein
MHRSSARFRRCLEKLPELIQRISKKQFDLLKTNRSHPSLHFKKVGKFWSVRIGLGHRALAVGDNGDYIWVWIGTHDEYERMIKSEGK